MTDEFVDPQPLLPIQKRKRARLLVADDDGTVFVSRELAPDVAAARRSYLASFSGRTTDARALGAVDDDGGPGDIADGLHRQGRPWYDFKRSIGREGVPVLPPADLDGLPADADRQPAEDQP
jgi:hypothetical protein